MANPNFTCVLDAWREGTTLFGRMHYYRSGSYTYQDTTFPDPTMNLGGTVFTDTDFGNRVRAGISVGDVYTTTFSRTVSGTGTRTVTFTAGSGLRSDFEGTWSVDVGGFPGTVTPPTGLACTINEVGPDFAKFNVSISSYGNPSSENGRWIEGGIAGQNAWQSPSLRSAIVQNVTSATITVDNNSTQTTTLTIVPNTEYYYGAYATNTQASSNNIFGQLVTLPPATTISNPVVTSDSATFNYSVPNQGGRHDMTLSYQLDGGGLTTITTLTGSGTKAGTFTVPNLSAGTTHTITAALTTPAGEVVSNTITFTTVSSGAFYGSVNGQTKKVTKLYGSVNGQTKLITKLYGSVNGVTKRIF